MSYQPYYVADFEQNSGLETYYESFLLPEKAFPVLEDAYCWRGRVKRREGFYLLGRLRRAYKAAGGNPYVGLAATNGGNYFVADALSLVRPTEPNAELDANTVDITIARGTGTQTIYSDDGAGNLTMIAGGTYTITSGSINYITGAISLIFTVAPAAGLTVDIGTYYFPALPVMGLETEEQTYIYQEKMIAFDQKYAYEYDYTLNRFIELTNSFPTTWQGSNAQLFWTTNYYYVAATGNNIFWATNFNSGVLGDPIRYYDTTGWTDFSPAIGGGLSLQQALCLIPFKGRLLAFNTYEGTDLATAVNFPRRVRWSWVGNPTDQVNGWLTSPGAGGFLDAATDEHIVSVEALKDVILVKFERSSWKLIYTGNQIQPFVFQRINSTFGAQSTHSLIPFDDGVFAVARNAITTDDTTSVERIDVNIPQQVFSMLNLTGLNIPTPLYPGNRTYGIRDYVNEFVYWAYQDTALYSAETSSTFNNRVLALNYRNKSYAIFNDSFTCYGYFQSTAALTDAFIPNVPDIAAGNQQGFVEILNKQVLNSPSLSISSISSGAPVRLNVPNHNFSVTAVYYVKIDGIIGLGPNSPDILNFASTPAIYRVVSIDANTISLLSYNAATDTFNMPVNLAVGGTYLGGGTLTVIQNYNIKTKVFCPFYQNATKQRLPYIDFLLERTTKGQATCLIYENEAAQPINANSLYASGVALGTNILLTTTENVSTGSNLVPQQDNQAKIWHRFYVQSICQNLQIQLTMSNAQIAYLDPTHPEDYSLSINNNDFILHAMVFYLSPTARLVQ